jgi:15-cis-phytoene synthase
MTTDGLGSPSARCAQLAAPSPAVLDAYAHCAEIARRSGSSFLAAFWMFPRAERRALHAIYAFCRLVDDIADDPALRGDRGMLLERWHEELVDAYRGKARHPVGIALGDAVHRFHLPEDCFLDLLAGIEADLRGGEVETFAELEHYCYCVASTIGLLVCGVRGLRGERVREYAVNLGIAVQLTNVLRDVGDDAAAGRVYLAREDREAHGVSVDSLGASAHSAPLARLLSLYAARARARYARAESALPAELRRRLRPAQAMGAIYRELLDALERRDFPHHGPALRLSKSRRVAIAAREWLGFGARASRAQRAEGE